MLKFFKGAAHSFPMQLLLLHLRSNLLLTFLWITLFLFTSGLAGGKYGVFYLFVDPEYLGQVDFKSFFIMGVAFSMFLSAWNTASYIINGHHFPFLASIARPFSKFCLNNSLIPTIFVIFYLVRVVTFQWNNELRAEDSIVFDVLGFLSGMLTGIFFVGFYFRYTNKDIFYFSKYDSLNVRRTLFKLFSKRETEDQEQTKQEIFKHTWDVRFYFSTIFKLKRVRQVDHYHHFQLERVFRQNHTNALLIQIFGITVLIGSGLLMEFSYCRIPAGASVLILFTILTTMLGALTYWLREWRAVFLMSCLALINFLSGRGIFDNNNRVYGLNYNKIATYNNRAIDSITNYKNFISDKQNTIEILSRWKRKFSSTDSLYKPKLVVICASGGGLRAASWATTVLQQADSLTHGQLMKHTVLMTGASGGMLGLGYMREVYMRKIQGEKVNFYDKKHYYNVNDDVLNAIGFTILVNDLFLPWIKFEYKGQKYYKDRGYMFERQFVENTDNLLIDRKINDYYEPERQAKIPMMFLTPVIINDGRQLIFSPQPISYMTRPEVAYERSDLVETDAVEFNRLFAKNNKDSVRFVTALRMNATYPYILPNVYLPTTPTIQVMDAGFRDNYGLGVGSRFIHTFRDWIRNNTSGVVFIQVRGGDKYEEVEPVVRETVMNKLGNSFGTVGSFTDLQDYAQDEMINHLQDALGSSKVDVIRFSYKPSKLDRKASISFHLNTREKTDIRYAIYLPENQKSLKKLLKLLK